MRNSRVRLCCNGSPPLRVRHLPINTLNFVLRWPSGVVAAIWTTWLILCVASTWELFVWHLEYFKNPGPEYYRVILATLPLLALLIGVYCFFRRKVLWRFELAALGLLLASLLLIYSPVAAFVVLGILIACHGAGRAAFEKLDLGPVSRAEDLTLSTALGLGLLMFVLFVLGLCGLYQPRVLGAIFVAAVLLCFRHVKALTASSRALNRAWASSDELRLPMIGVAVSFAGVFLVLGVLVSLAPSVAHDPVVMHLPSAMFYSAKQALVPLADLDYSYFPQGFEVLMTAACMFAGQAAAQMISPALFGLTALLVFAIARECGLSRAPAVAATIFGASIPFLHWTGSVAKNDMAFALFQLAALHCYLRARRSPAPNWLRLGVFFVASSFAVKHSALFGAVPLAVLYVHLLWKRGRLLREAIIMAGIFAVFGLCWQARTFALTGNPVYPIQWHYAVEALRPDSMRAPDAMSIPYYQIPWRIHFDGMLEGLPAAAFESPLSNPMGLFLVVCLPVWVLVRRASKNSLEPVCLAFSAVYFLYWGAVWPVLRYAIPLILVLVVLTAGRLWALSLNLPRLAGRVTELALAYCLAFALLGTMIIEVNAAQLRLFAGKIDENQYLREVLVPYPSLEYLRDHSAAGDRTLSINNCVRTYAADIDSFRCIFVQDDGLGPGQVAKAFRESEYELLILPEDKLGEALRKIIAAGHPLNRIYRDSHYSVYRFDR